VPSTFVDLMLNSSIVPDAVAAPDITAAFNQPRLDVSWVAPDSNGQAIFNYKLGIIQSDDSGTEVEIDLGGTSGSPVTVLSKSITTTEF